MERTIFISHTKADVGFLDAFDRVVARVGIRAFRSEFETITTPAWETIKKAMQQSSAMFLLVGTQLVAYQTYHPPEWEYTRNWIAFEIGLACQRRIDVWVVCDEGIELNFPVPYFNNYAPFGISSQQNFEFMKEILSTYKRGGRFPIAPHGDRFVNCPYPDCGAEFNLHARLEPQMSLPCPQCLQPIVFRDGFLVT